MLQMNLPHPPSAREQAPDGSYGACTTEFFLKVDYSGEQGYRWPGTPTFLDQINTPDRLGRYLESIKISDIPQEGVDHRRELNLGGTSLIGIIWKGMPDISCWRAKPRNYSYHAGLQPTLRAFISRWQDPETGFFGPWYRINRSIVKKTALSTTFHTASYARALAG